MKIVDKVKFWCYKILPTVYDDSLSYYEVLCKVQSKLNEVIEVVNEIPDDMVKLISEGTIVKEAVDSYIADSNIIAEKVMQYLDESDSVMNAVNSYIDTGVVENKVNEVVNDSPLIPQKIEEILENDNALKNAIIDTIERGEIPTFMGGTVPWAISNARNQGIYLHLIELFNAIDPASGVSSSARFWVYSKQSTPFTNNSGENNSATLQDIIDFLGVYVGFYGQNAPVMIQFDSTYSTTHWYSYGGFINNTTARMHGVRFVKNDNLSNDWNIVVDSFGFNVSSDMSTETKTYFREVIANTGSGNFN